MNYYTGTSSHHFLSLFAFLNAGDICSRLRYWGSNNSSIKGQKRSLQPKDELFLTLARLRVNIPKKVLADNYKISVAEIIPNSLAEDLNKICKNLLLSHNKMNKSGHLSPSSHKKDKRHMASTRMTPYGRRKN
ncbi:hypothetical protein P5673_015162 [Acropora cervicornis]|uniref:Uncharacterized protein n=1 Tax=Acropora cervicornis TaxID=6130 RepID=A0AAD9QIA8_ACRCE|nr:hypothetical protein P5673_015162 [Acropora cervicornis]